MRSLWKNKTFTALNIVGLAIGISASWIMYQYVSYEFSYDAAYPLRDRVYRVGSWFTMDGKSDGNSGAPKPLAAAAAEVTGVEMAVPVFGSFASSVKVGPPNAPGKRYEEINLIAFTNNDYFRLVPYQWLAGNAANALTDPNQVVLTAQRATKYFPGASPADIVGQTLTYNDTLQVTVSGVVANLDYPSSFIIQEFRSNSGRQVTDAQWGSVNSNDQCYLLLAEGASKKDIETQINRISNEKSGERLAKWNMTRSHLLQSMQEVHFGTQFVGDYRTANKNVLFVLMGVAGFLLVLACINYINLATARIPQRAREIGVRKTLGSSNRAILARFFAETALTATLAVGLSGLLTALFFRYYGDLLPEEVVKNVNWLQTTLFLTALVGVVTLLSGWYPAWLTTRFRPVQVLRGQVDHTPGRGFTLRKGLIIFQFAVAQVFVTGALIVGEQLHFVLNQDLGFNREAVVLVNIDWKILEKPAFKEKQFTLLENIQKQPGIAAAALGEPLFSQSFSSNTHTFTNEKGEEVKRNMYRKYADTGMLPLYGMKLLAGRNLAPADTIKEYVINETAVREFGFASPQAAIGQFLHEEEGVTVPIVGVVNDFHTASFTEKMEPLAFMTDRQNLSTLNIKLSSRNPSEWQSTLKAVEAQWQQFYPTEPFKYTFYDDTLREVYEQEQKMARIINLATTVALLISCLGLFGLATFMANRRTKEIGIRKVLGAHAASITSLLVVDFLKLVIIAVVLASPLAWYLMNKWLASYAYHITLSASVLVLSGFMAVLIAILTVSIQSVRAAFANPVEALKSE